VLEAVVVSWEKHPGDWVDAEDPICVVSADGLRAVVGSSASGYLVRLLTGVGARIAPGASLAEIATVDPAGDPGDATGPAVGPPRPALPNPEPVAKAPQPPIVLEPDPVPISSFHSPAVRRLADELGIDLGQVRGTGAGGRVRKEDVLAYVGPPPSMPGVPSTAVDRGDIRPTGRMKSLQSPDRGVEFG
jgi:2-oxoglutarate dehydrogenase E2 component (dihydrolipoamide succinyltransferase)